MNHKLQNHNILEPADTLEIILLTDSPPWLYIRTISVALKNNTSIGPSPQNTNSLELASQNTFFFLTKKKM